MWEKRKLLCEQSDAIADAVMSREKVSSLQKYWAWRVSVDFDFDIVEVVGERWEWRRPRLGLQDCPALGGSSRVNGMVGLGGHCTALHGARHCKTRMWCAIFSFFFLEGGGSSCCTVTAAGSKG